MTTGRGMDKIAAGAAWRSTSGRTHRATISEAILSVVLVLGALRAADDKAVDAVGTRKCTYEVGGQQRTSTLTIEKHGDKLTGTMYWPDQKEKDHKDLKLTDNTLTWHYLIGPGQPDVQPGQFARQS